MIFTCKQYKKLRPPAVLRKRLFAAVLSALCLLSACIPSGQLNGQTKGVIDILHIQPFRLEKPYKFDWQRNRPEVSSGMLVVIKVDTSLVRPTNGLQPVLYAGNHIVQRINQGYESGYVIGIIPAQTDLSKEPVWFGTPGLPEDIDEKTIRYERAKAVKAGIRPMKAADVNSRTRETTAVKDLTTLLRQYAAPLILEYAPQEKHLVEAWRLPETR